MVQLSFISQILLLLVAITIYALLFDDLPHLALAYLPNRNGLAEGAVQIVKRGLEKLKLDNRNILFPKKERKKKVDKKLFKILCADRNFR